MTANSATSSPVTYDDPEYLPRECTFSRSDWQVLARFWFPIALAKDITDKPHPVRLLDENLVVFRTSKGCAVAKDLCVHRGSPLSLGWMNGDDIVCPYHGYRYNFEGQCTLVPSRPDWNIPRKLCLQMFPAVERYGVIWTHLRGEPANVIPDWDIEWEDKNFRWFTWGPHVWNCSAGRAIENFIDNAHFSFVHRGSFGQESSAEMGAEYALDIDDAGMLMVFDYLAANPEDSPIKGASNLQRTMRRRLTYPFCTRSHIQYPDGQDHIIHIVIAPVSARRSQITFLFSRNFDHHVPVEELLSWEKRILSEDRGIIEAQKPEEIPLELANEVHVRADKASVALRKWMIEQGLGRAFTA
jgi:phenylpropionate dioxygenase-like ring-hydroxylating dioxygenase large terminal subunit